MNEMPSITRPARSRHRDFHHTTKKVFELHIALVQLSTQQTCSARPHYSSYASTPGCRSRMNACTLSSSASTYLTTSSIWSCAAASANPGWFGRDFDCSNLSIALTSCTPSDRMAITCTVQLKCSWSASIERAMLRCSSARRLFGTASASQYDPFSRTNSATAASPASEVRAFLTASCFAERRAFLSCRLAMNAAPPIAAIAPKACTQLAHSALVMQKGHQSIQNRQYSCGGLAAFAASASAFINWLVSMSVPQIALR